MQQLMRAHTTSHTEKNLLASHSQSSASNSLTNDKPSFPRTQPIGLPKCPILGSRHLENVVKRNKSSEKDRERTKSHCCPTWKTRMVIQSLVPQQDAIFLYARTIWNRFEKGNQASLSYGRAGIYVLNKFRGEMEKMFAEL
jgi:hypothetical protein